MTEGTALLLLVLACGAGTYLWRGLGVILSGRVNPGSALFAWAGCVAYAMIAGLVARIIFLPAGTLAHSLLQDRLVACGVALIAYFVTRKNLFAGVGAGFAAVIALSYGRAII